MTKPRAFSVIRRTILFGISNVYSAQLGAVVGLGMQGLLRPFAMTDFLMTPLLKLPALLWAAAFAAGYLQAKMTGRAFDKGETE